ncbi:hypothetical protein Hypma_001081 [Hypsizygus marmoreus]|uniref:DUF7729 domain-containing protein n=1 Tax=Hypsizygus marmoreus TaxID=39966 RepID=A0A369J8G1_HYPMA|nr:hypothetical protein Hypma_001081 [Hypsizygus marmoreus]
MFKTIAIVSLFTSAALAQSSTLIPSGISDGCSSYLNKLNSDKSFTTCTSSLITATSDYSPGSNATTTPSTAKVSTTLAGFCSTSTDSNCPESLIRGELTDFYAACSAELTSASNQDVIRIYDVLYTIAPLRAAACSKDDSGNYCVTQEKLPTSGPAAGQLQKVLSTGSPALIPNTTTYRSNNIPFLFLQSAASAEELCNVCTRNILSAWINFESRVPYAPGLSKSAFLSNQPDLYQSVQDTCGSTFLSGAGVQAAGGLSGGTFSSGAVQMAVGSAQGFVAAGMSILALIASVAL